MQKRFTIFCSLFLILLLSGSLFAQDMFPPANLEAAGNIGKITLNWDAPVNPNAQGFEGGAIPADWQALDNDADGHNWYVWDAFVNNGMYAVASFSYDNNTNAALTPDNWLITPALELGADASMQYFVGASDDEWYWEHYQVKLSTTGTDPADFTVELLDHTLGETAAGMFEMKIIDLSAYNGQTVHIAFVHNNVTDVFNLTLDDIAFSGLSGGKEWNVTFENPDDIRQFTTAQTYPVRLNDINNEKAVSQRMHEYRQAKSKAANIEALESFNVYRNGSLIVNTTDLFYIDMDMDYDIEHSYYVTAVYSEGESDPSNTVYATATDPGDIVFIDTFEDMTNWTPMGLGTGNWQIDDSENAMGTAPELNLYWSPSFVGIAQAISPVINVTPGTALTLKFKQYLDHFSMADSPYEIGIGYTQDGGTTIENIYYLMQDPSTAGDVGPEEQEIAFSAVADMQLVIWFSGDVYEINNWWIDDLIVSGGGVIVSSGFEAAINITDGETKSAGVLTFGTDEEATDGIDETLGELELPPVPPAGAFDARFILPDNTTASLMDIRPTEQAEVTWKMTFQPGDGGYPFTFSWDPADLPDGSFYLVDPVTGGTLINVNMKDVDNYTLTNTNITSLQIVYSTSMSVEFHLNAGWNIVSCPVVLDDMTVAGMFPDATSNAYMFDNGYTMVNEFHMGEGYWLKFGEEGMHTMSGMPFTEGIAVNAGWNIIGPYEYEVMVNDIYSEPAGIVETYFYGFDNGYSQAASLLPGQGYWVKASQEGMLYMNPVGKENAETDNGRAAFYNIMMTVNDGQLGSYDLSIGIDPAATEGLDQALGEAELPPAPPAGIFDARMVFPDNLISSFDDYRTGQEVMNGSHAHTLKWQLGENSAGLNATITIPEVPGDVTMTIVDPFGGTIVNETYGEGVHQLTVTNTALTSLNITVDYSGVIPVELNAFAANVIGESVQLQWSTATETNNRGFEVERSSDNKSFSKIAFVDGHGTTSEKQSYSYTDFEVSAGTYYYRLVQVDFDGTRTISEVKEVSFLPQEFSLGQNYPNPFNPSTRIKFALPVDAKVVMKLYNSLGQEVAELTNAQFSAGLHEVNFNASSISSGVYFYTIEAAGSDGTNFTQVKKMMFMK